MAYFNKNDFRKLIKIWRWTLRNNENELQQKTLLRDDEWLMANFYPIKFICDIESEMKKR